MLLVEVRTISSPLFAHIAHVCAVASPCSQETYCVAGDVRPCPYAGAKFPVTMVFPPTYPFKLPQVVHCSLSLLVHRETTVAQRHHC